MSALDEIDWTGNRKNERYTYVRVKYPELYEAGEYGNIVSGSVSKSEFSSVKETCEFSFVGGDAPDAVDGVRIYYSFEDEGGNVASVPIGTYLVSYSDISHEYVGATWESEASTLESGSVSGSSMLSVLADVTLGYPMTVSAGTDYVGMAYDLARARNLKVSLARKGDGNVYRNAKDHTFESSDSLLTAINYMLNAADYAACRVDAYGTVIMEPYVPPIMARPAFTFKDGANSIIGMEVTEKNDYLTAPNVVKLVYESENECLYAEASNLKGSRNSLEARCGRELTLFDSDISFPDSISEENEDTPGIHRNERIDYLKRKAERRLKDNSTETVHVEFEHPYIPIQGGDYARIEYGGKTFDVNVTNMDIDLSASTACRTSGRHIDRYDIETSVSGRAVWVQ